MIVLWVEPDIQQKTLEVYRRLLAVFGERPLKMTRDPMRTLVGTMLSHRTTNEATRQAFDTMWAQFGSWEAIMNAPVDALTRTIAASTFPEAKAPNIQSTIRRIIEEHGAPNIDFLRDVPTDEALAWLLSLPGVGIKTATLTLLFVFAKPVIPVDTHVYRVCQRIGLIGPKVSAEKAHYRLLELLPPDPLVLYTAHLNFMEHGRTICVWDAPRCERCPLTDLCDWYQTHRRPK